MKKLIIPAVLATGVMLAQTTPQTSSGQDQTTQTQTTKKTKKSKKSKKNQGSTSDATSTTNK
ncbi:MAG TPA: hypothetical protein VFA28_05680 [Bryobacteraceae bacterium]|jgi:hypothetical protein|nr:hypothetical protein [Bryobacteraceae bacterium]